MIFNSYREEDPDREFRIHHFHKNIAKADQFIVIIRISELVEGMKNLH